MEWQQQIHRETEIGGIHQRNHLIGPIPPKTGSLPGTMSGITAITHMVTTTRAATTTTLITTQAATTTRTITQAATITHTTVTVPGTTLDSGIHLPSAEDYPEA